MTYPRWDGERCEATVVRVIVGAAPSGWWCNGLKGTEREAVRVRTKEGSLFYLDNEDGSGWAKVTKGRGMWTWPHNSLPIEREVERTKGAKP